MEKRSGEKMNAKIALKIWNDYVEQMRRATMSRDTKEFSRLFAASREATAAMLYLSTKNLCLQCGRKMRQLKPYVWRCKCMPKGMRLIKG